MELTPGYQQSDAGAIPDDWQMASIDSLVEATAPICYGVVQVGKHTNNGIPIVAIKYVKEIASAPLHRTPENIERPFSRSRPQGGDVLISIKGTIGRVGIVPGGFEGNISRELARIRVRNEISPDFIAHQLEASATQDRIMRAVVGTTRLEFSISTLRQFELPMPPTKAEQIKIAEALSDIDALIAGLERLIAKKRDIKQAAMQQLLPGQTRLPGFSGEWSRRRLGELAEMGSGGTPPAGNPDYYGGAIPWVAISDMTQAGKFIERTERSLSDSGLANSAAQLFPAGTVLYAMYASLGECSIACMELCTSQAILGIRPRTGLVRDFLYYSLTSRKEFVKTLGQQGTQSNLNKGIVQGFEIHLPPPKEQTAIATALSDMDADLSALESRLAKTRAIKQGMMQELLTGRTRLV